MSDKKPVIFISYARKDEPDTPKRGEVQWRTYVQSYLAPASLNGIVHIWADEGIRGGDKWKKEIETQQRTCDLFILLVSINSLASDVVVNFEIKTIQGRQAKGENVHIFPIVLEPFPKKAVPWLMELNLRPKAGKPLSEFSVRARKSEMVMIADEVVEIIAQVTAEKELTQPSSLEEPITAQGIVDTPSGHVVIDITHLPETAYERLVGRETELKRLDDAWPDRNTNILSLIAEGGAGKSALANEWLKRMQADNYRDAESVLGWSFYSQGTKERATSAEQFLNWALEKLDIKIETTSATAKGEAIAEALGQRRVLLVLDGCEPLQHGLDRQHGELKDQGLRALLRRLASMPPSQTHGLVVLTSRLAVQDIARWRSTSAPVEPVDKLSDKAGAALLRDNGVWGTDKELQAAARDFAGHPLALGLLSSLLKETQRGDVRRRDRIRALLQDADDPRHGHARRVMASYEVEWLADRPVEHAIMRIVGLFDRPAAGDCLRALRKKPAILGLTDALVDIEEDEWQRGVARLREARLLAPKDPSAPDALDAHPLVREWFGERLKQTSKVAWKSAHGRIYEHLRDTTKESKTPTLEQLAPLYQAIAHGCRAERYQAALDDIYQGRICRRKSNEELEYYAMYYLGAMGSDLAAISWFCRRPYEIAVAALKKTDRSWVLGVAAFILRAQGRFAEAIPAQRVALSLAETAQDWINAAVRANNLTECEFLVGELAAAMASAERSNEYAERTDDKLMIMGIRATHAKILHAAGRRAEAERLFVDIENDQKKVQAEYPWLYSVRGYLYCDLLIDKGDWVEASERASKVLEWEVESDSLLERGLARLALGRTSLGLGLTALRDGRNSAMSNNTLTARARLDEAVDGVRNSGHGQFVSACLLARAAFRRNVGDFGGATRDLDEIEELAGPGPMKLYLCDMALECTRLAFAKIEAFAPLNGLIDNSPPKPAAPGTAEAARLMDEAAKQLLAAADYIKSCGYHRRDEELAELEAVLRGEKKFADLPPRV
jgi:hypothetical protein